jgi:hypothetical protein
MEGRREEKRAVVVVVRGKLLWIGILLVVIGEMEGTRQPSTTMTRRRHKEKEERMGR